MWWSRYIGGYSESTLSECGFSLCVLTAHLKITLTHKRRKRKLRIFFFFLLEKMENTFLVVCVHHSAQQIIMGKTTCF